MKFVSLGLCLTICLSAGLSVAAQKKSGTKVFTTSGFYDAIRPSGKPYVDFEGMSVYLTQSADKTFALVTTTDNGRVSKPILVEAKMTGKDMRNIEFTLPGAKGDNKYTGTVAASGLTLNQDKTKSILQRECGKVFSNISMGKGGDYGGTEILITEGSPSIFALVTTAEGMIGEPVLVSMTSTGKNYENISFNLGERKFAGTIGKTSLTLNEGGTKTVLKSKCY